MNKFITICGSPASGKTVTGIKLAQEIYESTKARVLFFCSDLNVPVMGFLFPHCKNSDLYSIGKALDQTDIYKEDVLRRIVTVKTMRDFGYIGFKSGENKYTYPRPTEDKVRQLFSCMREISDYIIADCVSDASDLISAMAKTEADSIIQLVTPDLKCMTYYSSNAEQFAAISDRAVRVMNIREKDMYLPKEEVSAYFKDIRFRMPFSFGLNKQAYTGTLSEQLSDNKYRKAMSELAKAVM